MAHTLLVVHGPAIMSLLLTLEELLICSVGLHYLRNTCSWLKVFINNQIDKIS